MEVIHRSRQRERLHRAVHDILHEGGGRFAALGLNVCNAQDADIVKGRPVAALMT